jgi:hypothetical protein
MNEIYLTKLIKSIILESKATEAQGLGILSKKGVENPETIIQKMAAKDKSSNQKNIPSMAFMYDGNIPLEAVISVFNDYNELEVKRLVPPMQLTKNSIKVGNDEFKDFIKFSEFVHFKSEAKLDKSPEKNQDTSFEPSKKPMWSGNGIDIYFGKNMLRCIEYTQGGLTGKAYSFCIGNPNLSHNMFRSYRSKQGSTFYFIVDRNKFKTNPDGTVNLDDPLHMVVFDNTGNGIQLTDAGNNTGRIHEFGTDVNAYIEYLKSKKVPVEKLIQKPVTPQEQELERKFSVQNPSLDWFKNLDNPKHPDYAEPDLEPGETAQNYYKSMYIGLGRILSDEQFDFLLKNL